MTVYSYEIDATKFQRQLAELASTIAFKVQREGPKMISGHPSLFEDIYVLLRQAQRTYDLFFYLNADETREKDCNWRLHYSIVALPLVRCMIDCLYNITALLEDPKSKGAEFRRSGYKMALSALEEDQQKYGNHPNPSWQEWLQKRRENLDFCIRRDGFTVAEVLAQPRWPTLGQYLRPAGRGTALTQHQQFLRTLTYGYWREYSEYAHATFQGLLEVAMIYLVKDAPHENRDKIESQGLSLMFHHMGRAAAVLLCIVTELQARFRFEGAHIGERLLEIWGVLVVAPEIKELYDTRYEGLMKSSGIDSR
jgi:hypothetical protein